MLVAAAHERLESLKLEIFLADTTMGVCVRCRPLYVNTSKGTVKEQYDHHRIYSADEFLAT